MMSKEGCPMRQDSGGHGWRNAPKGVWTSKWMIGGDVPIARGRGGGHGPNVVVDCSVISV